MSVGLSRLQILMCLLALVLGASLAGVVGASAADPDPTPAVQLHLDTMQNTQVGPSGTTPVGDTPDSSGHNLSAKATGTIVPGRFANALQTDYEQDGVVVTSDPLLQPAHVTAMAWVKHLGTPAAGQEIVGKGGNECAANDYGLKTGPTGGLVFSVMRSGGGEGSITEATPELPAASIWDGQWHAIAGTYDGNTVRLWVDGQTKGFNTATPADQPIAYDGPSSAPYNRLFVGDYPNAYSACAAGDSQFHGTIDEVRVYGRALSNTELAYLQRSDHTAPPNLPVPNTPPPPFTVKVTGPSSPPVAGRPSSFVATPNQPVDHYDWDLNGDGRQDAQCNGATPKLAAEFARAYSGPVSVTAFGQNGSKTVQSFSVKVAAGSSAGRSGLIKLYGNKIIPHLVPPGVTSSYPSATCQTAQPGTKVDLTKNGGPTAACPERIATAGLVIADGCFERVAKAKTLPRPELELLAKLDDRFASSLAQAKAGAARTRAARAGPNARTSASFVQFALQLVQNTSGLHLSHSAIRVNGIDYVPLGGASIVLHSGQDPMSDAECWLASSNVSVQINGKEIRRGPLALAVALKHKRVHVTDFDVQRDVPFASSLTMGQGSTSLDIESGKSLLSTHLGLPGAVFGNVTGDATITFTNFDGAQLSDLAIQMGNFAIGGIGVNRATLFYHDKPLTLNSDIDLSFGKGPRVTAALGLGEVNGDHKLHFRSFAGAYYGPPYITLDPGIDITYIDGHFDLFPPRTVFGAGARVTVGEPVTCAPYRVDAHVDVTFYPSPLALDATGTGHIFCNKVAQAFFHVDTTGFVHFGGHVTFSAGDLLSLEGGVDARFFYPHFTAEGKERGCIAGFVCADGQGIISDKGLALCYGVFLGIDKKVFGKRVKIGGTVQIGGGFDWPPPATLVNPVLTAAAILKSAEIFTGCDFTDYRTVAQQARVSAAGPAGTSFNVTRGQRAFTLAVKGAGGHAPDIEVRGPDRAPIVLPPSGPLKGREDATGFRSPKDGTSYVVVGFPGAGRWSVVARPGSSAIISVRRAFALPEPSIRLSRRHARGGRIAFSYRVKPIAGQRVTFLEEVGSAARKLGVARSHGVLSFFPSTARGTRRRIVAFVEQSGRPRANLTVARFNAKPTRPARPPHLRAVRRGSSLLVRWGAAAHAESYIGRISLTDGRRLMFFVSARARSFVVRHLGTRTTARVMVTGVLGRNVQGSGASLRVRRPRRR